MKEEIREIGESVVCDFCDADYSKRDESGGLLFQSKAACPVCAPGIEASAKKYGEERFIKSRCPAGISFREWVLSLRNGNNSVRTLTFNNAEEMVAYLKGE